MGEQRTIGQICALTMLASAVLACAGAAPALAQPADLPIAPATTQQYPPGVSVQVTSSGPVYTDAQGHTLYGMDMRTLIRWNPYPEKFCQSSCGELWEPLLAPADARPNVMYPRGFGERRPGPSAPSATPPRPGPPPLPPGFISPQAAPDWAVIAGPNGPQWVYKGWHVVYTRKGEAPGSTAFDGADQLIWNTLKFVPPVPKLVAPSGVAATLVGGAYALTDKSGHVLFVGKCAAPCAFWLPLAAPMASRGIGEWTASATGDGPQWVWRGKPVYVSQESDPRQAPSGGELLRP